MESHSEERALISKISWLEVIFFQEGGKGWEVAWQNNGAPITWTSQLQLTMLSNTTTQLWEKAYSPTQQGLPVTLTDGSQGGCEVRALKPDSRKARSVLREN